jgi:hypothetical protein
MKRFALLCAAVLLAACDAAYEDVYYDVIKVQEDGRPLSSAEELAKIGVDEAYPLDGAYYLAADIELPEGEWTPIGNVDAPFSGIFDGKGRTVRGLQLKSGSARYTGLFGYLLRARLSNLTIEVKNTEVSLSLAGAQYAGAAAGYIKASIVRDITVKEEADGQLELVKTGSGNFYAGGLAGEIEGSPVSNIKVKLNLKATGSADIYAGLVAGEIALSPIASCLVEGGVDAETAGTRLYAGGVAGRTTGRVSQLENCVSAASVYGYFKTGGSAYIYVGGITGNNGAAIISCRVESGHPLTVQGKSGYTGSAAASYIYVGGVSGSGSSSSIDKCLVDADIDIIAEAVGFANLCAGGIAGEQSGDISASLVRRGSVKVKSDPTLTDTYGRYLAKAGGISGRLTDAVKIQNCFSVADVSVEVPFKTESIFYVTAAGGIAGEIYQTASVEESGSSGAVSVKSTYASGDGVSAGGIAGLSTDVAVIRKCVALNGSVKTESTGTTTPYAYRVLGAAVKTSDYSFIPFDDIPASSIRLERNYALPGMTVQTKQGGAGWTDVDQPDNTRNLAGSGTIERTQASFEERLGWDFDKDWYWDSAANLPFPRYE